MPAILPVLDSLVKDRKYEQEGISPFSFRVRLLAPERLLLAGIPGNFVTAAATWNMDGSIECDGEQAAEGWTSVDSNNPASSINSFVD